MGFPGQGRYASVRPHPLPPLPARPCWLSPRVQVPAPSTRWAEGRTRQEGRDFRAYRSTRTCRPPLPDERFGVGPWGPRTSHRDTAQASCSPDQRCSRIHVTLKAAQENMDLFPLTLAWSRTLTVTGQPHAFRLTQDGITNTHAPACSPSHAHTHTPHTHTPIRLSHSASHSRSHTHTIVTIAYEGTMTHTQESPWAHEALFCFTGGVPLLCLIGSSKQPAPPPYRRVSCTPLRGGGGGLR